MAVCPLFANYNLQKLIFSHGKPNLSITVLFAYTLFGHLNMTFHAQKYAPYNYDRTAHIMSIKAT